MTSVNAKYYHTVYILYYMYTIYICILLQCIYCIALHCIFKVPIWSMGIFNICTLWILLRKIVIYLVGWKFHLHKLFSLFRRIQRVQIFKILTDRIGTLTNTAHCINFNYTIMDCLHVALLFVLNRWVFWPLGTVHETQSIWYVPFYFYGITIILV